MNKKIYVTRKQFDMITESINEDYAINPTPDIEIRLIDQRPLLLPHAQDIWNILQGSYEHIGGLKTYRDFSNFKKNLRSAKIAYSNNNIVACEIYRKEDTSYKAVAVGSDGSNVGRKAARLILQDDIAQEGLHFWAEVSGAIEHLFKEYNGNPIPSKFASTVLSMGMKNPIVVRELGDGLHYEREIGPDKSVFKKCIYGFKNKEVADMVLNSIDQYIDFKKTVNAIGNRDELLKKQPRRRVNEAREYKINDYPVREGIAFVNTVYDLYMEQRVVELPQSWVDMLKICRQLFQMVDTTTGSVEDYIDYIDIILDDTQIFTIHEFNIK